MHCTGIEHKLGIHGSPTCSMSYENATGYLLGEENRGLAVMFVMMNNARLAVGVEGVGIAERAYQQAQRVSRPSACRARSVASRSRSTSIRTCSGCS